MESEDSNPRHHVRQMRQRLEELITHLLSDISKVSEPQLRAMFETSAEVLLGLAKTFRDCERKNEAAWKQ